MSLHFPANAYLKNSKDSKALNENLNSTVEALREKQEKKPQKRNL
jgi:hypothetical protein